MNKITQKRKAIEEFRKKHGKIHDRVFHAYDEIFRLIPGHLGKSDRGDAYKMGLYSDLLHGKISVRDFIREINGTYSGNMGSPYDFVENIEDIVLEISEMGNYDEYLSEKFSAASRISKIEEDSTLAGFFEKLDPKGGIESDEIDGEEWQGIESVDKILVERGRRK